MYKLRIINHKVLYFPITLYKSMSHHNKAEVETSRATLSLFLNRSISMVIRMFYCSIVKLPQNVTS